LNLRRVIVEREVFVVGDCVFWGVEGRNEKDLFFLGFKVFGD